jgi:hypothetical protein
VSKIRRPPDDLRNCPLCGDKMEVSNCCGYSTHFARRRVCRNRECGGRISTVEITLERWQDLRKIEAEVDRVRESLCVALASLKDAMWARRA